MRALPSKLIMALVLKMLCMVSLAQEIPRDTTFNLNDDLKKNIKKYPFIKQVSVSKQVGIKSNIVYSGPTTRELHTDVYFPLEKRKTNPTVVMVHGGGWRSGNKEMMAGFASRLAERGFIVVVPEYRLSLEAVYPAGINDLKKLLEWCYTNDKKYGFDTKRLAILGTSSGAQMASQIGNNIQTKFKVSATINIDGVLAFRHPESTEGAVAMQWLGGSYEEKTDTWLEASALHNVNKFTAPILFIGSSMPRFHAGRSDMIVKLNKLNIYSDILLFDDSPHTFWFYDPWFEPMSEKIVTFLHKVW